MCFRWQLNIFDDFMLMLMMLMRFEGAWFDIQHVEWEIGLAKAPCRVPWQSIADSTGARIAHNREPVKPPVPNIMMLDGRHLVD